MAREAATANDIVPWYSAELMCATIRCLYLSLLRNGQGKMIASMLFLDPGVCLHRLAHQLSQCRQKVCERYSVSKAPKKTQIAGRKRER